jgi:hypothetical protein
MHLETVDRQDQRFRARFGKMGDMRDEESMAVPPSLFAGLAKLQ